MLTAIKLIIQKIAKPGASLKWRAIQGSLSVLSSDVYIQGLRLVGNLIMTRLLYPEAFGLMLIVNLLFTALAMLSDVGIASAVILKSRGRDESFLNTAWTMLMIRGALLTIAAIALAYPISLFYKEPDLTMLIIAASLSPLITAAASPQLLIAQRNVQVGKVALVQVLANTLSMIITLSWLFIHPTIWALAGHLLISAGLTSLISYIVLKAPIPTFTLDKEVVSEIFHFGKWIVISTVLTFLALHGDKLIISQWITAEHLGIFSVAITFSKLIDTVLGPLNNKLFFPVYAELKQGGTAKFAIAHRKVRILIFLLCSPVIIAFAGFGDLFIGLLYDPRYHEAGWMLQILSIGSLSFVLAACIGPVVLAHENSFLHMSLQVTRLALLISAMLLGGYLAGLPGLIIGIAIAPALFYPILLFSIRRYGIKVSALEYSMLATVIAAIMLLWYARGLPINIHG